MPNDNIFDSANEVIQELEQEIKDQADEAPASSEDIADETERRIPENEEEEAEGEEEAAPEAKEAAEGEEEEDEFDTLDLNNKKQRDSAFAKLRRLNKKKDKALKEANDRIAEYNERLARLEGQQQAQQNQQTKAPEAKVDEDPEPDPTIDKEAHLEWQIRNLNKKLEEVVGVTNTTAKNNTAILESRAVEELERRAVKDENLTDYDDALKYLWNKEAALIKKSYPNATDAQIKEHLQAEKVRLFKEYYRKDGTNAAKIIIEMAKEYGYGKKPTNPGKPNLDKIKTNMKKNTSLIGGTQAGGTGEVDPESVFNTSFEKLMYAKDSFFDKAIKSAQGE